MARWINMDNRIDTDFHDPCVPKQSVDASAYEEIDFLRCRIGFVGVEETGPRGQRRVADEGEKVRLKLPPSRRDAPVTPSREQCAAGLGTLTRTSRM